MTALQRALIGLSHADATLLWQALSWYVLDTDVRTPAAEALFEKLDRAAAMGDIPSGVHAPMSSVDVLRRMREISFAGVVTFEHGATHFAIIDNGKRYEGATTDEAFAAWRAARGIK